MGDEASSDELFFDEVYVQQNTDDVEDQLFSDALEFTLLELQACEKVISSLAAHPEHFSLPICRPLRQHLRPLLDIEQSRYYKGMSREEYNEEYDNRKARNVRRMKKAALDKKVINSKLLRSRRLEALRGLQQRANACGIKADIAVPDGAAFDNPYSLPEALPSHQSSSSTEQVLASKVNDASTKEEDRSGHDLDMTVLSCYICKMRFTQLHSFYAHLCPSCAAFNYEKRFFSASLEGRYAIVTGGRVKIGFQTALKLLRAGAHVVVTTRFPLDAYTRYQQEQDYTRWEQRLLVYGLDLRALSHVEQFCSWCLNELPCLDIIVNNACQTIRRPPAYYRRLITNEICSTVSDKNITRPSSILSTEVGNIPHLRHSWSSYQQSYPHKYLQHDYQKDGSISSCQNDRCSERSENYFNHLKSTAVVDVTREFSPQPSARDANASVLMFTNSHTSYHCVPEYIAPLAKQLAQSMSTSSMNKEEGLDMEVKGESSSVQLFPEGLNDVNNQQIDLRDTNSWLLKLEEVHTAEMIEVMSVNAIAPFIINGRLKEHLLRSAFADRYIVNVSAMEGKFYRFKTPNHPHTNMAKAALNMMTRTSADELAKTGVYMTAVDTGWINDENPVAKAAKIAQAHNFQTPIDEVDAAARILDPIFTGVDGLQSSKDFIPLHGVFLKDFRETEW